MNEQLRAISHTVRWLSYTAVALGLVLRVTGARMVFLGIGVPEEIGGAMVTPAPGGSVVIGFIALALAAAALVTELLASDRLLARTLRELPQGFQSATGHLLYSLAHPFAAAWFYFRFVLS